MGVLLRKKEGVYHLTGIFRLSLIALIASFASAFVETIWSVYLDSFVHSESIVGFISAGLTLISFFSYFVFIPFIESRDKRKIFAGSLIFLILFYLILSVNNNFYFFLAIAVLVTITYTLRVTSFGILIKDNSAKASLSRNEGLMYTFMNLAWVLGPLIAGYFATIYGLRSIFLLASLFLFLALFLFGFSSFKEGGKKNRKVDTNIVRNFIYFFKSPKRTLAYFLGAGVNLWWSLVYIFVPLMIIRHGLSDVWIGYFFFAVALPLILFEFYFSRWAGRNGFSKIFKGGYLIVAILSLSCFFISNIYVILGLLALASVGMAMLEPTTESYFFDILEGNEEYRFYGPYNTAMDTGNFVGRLFASVMLLFLPFRFLFLLFSILMTFFFVLSFWAKKIVEVKQVRV